MLLIDDLIALPFKGLVGVLRKIHEMADRELHDEAYIQQKLLELELLYEMGEIGLEVYTDMMGEWEARLNAVRGAEEEAAFEEVEPALDGRVRGGDGASVQADAPHQEGEG